MKWFFLAIAWLGFALPALAQTAGMTLSAAGPAAPAAGCQPGQVLLANGDSCVPPVSIPTPPLNALPMTPAVMSRMLAVTPKPPSVQSACQPGQVLQPNGEPCIPRSDGR
jgi:hypothetical protein